MRAVAGRAERYAKSRNAGIKLAISISIVVILGITAKVYRKLRTTTSPVTPKKVRTPGTGSSWPAKKQAVTAESIAADAPSVQPVHIHMAQHVSTEIAVPVAAESATARSRCGTVALPSLGAKVSVTPVGSTPLSIAR